MAVTFMFDPSPPITVPREAAESLRAFRDWAGSDELPENVQLLFHRGQVWVDMGKQQIFSHVAVKTEITRVLATLAKTEKLGIFLTDGVLLTHEEAELSVNPDAVFVSNVSLVEGQVVLVEGQQGGFVELVGSADMVLEVVSDSSEKKDTQTLFNAYFEAGILEYWLVDARGDEIDFHLYRRGPKRFLDARKQSGWASSKVFGRSFRLVRDNDSLGNPEFTLETRS